jgi:hypothetical protein
MLYYIGMAMKKTAFVEILQRVRGRCERMESKLGGSLWSWCGEGESFSV